MRIAWLALIVLFACDEHGKGGGMGFLDAPAGGAPCGGLAGAKCGATEFCDFISNDCGAGDGGGFCRPRPGGCTGEFSPTCGCDGQFHSSTCDANSAGFDVNAAGTCALAPGTFACGFRQCDRESSYCRREPNPGGADGFTCVAMPAGCGTSATCTCLVGEMCGTSCTGNLAQGLTVTCPQGI